MGNQPLWVALASSIVALAALLLNGYGLREARQKALLEKRWDRRADAYLNVLRHLGIGATGREQRVHFYDLRAPIVAFGSRQTLALFDEYLEAFDGLHSSRERADELEQALEKLLAAELQEGSKLVR